MAADKSVPIPVWAKTLETTKAVDLVIERAAGTGHVERVIDALSLRKRQPLSWCWRQLDEAVREVIAGCVAQQQAEHRAAIVATVFTLPVDVEIGLTPIALTKQRILEFVAEGGGDAEVSARWLIEHHCRLEPRTTAAELAELQGFAEAALCR
jgi:hypothetical protein